MTRYEYRTETIPHRDGTFRSSVHVRPEDADALLRQLGAEGWKVWPAQSCG
jgi:hypothetical protein